MYNKYKLSQIDITVHIFSSLLLKFSLSTKTFVQIQINNLLQKTQNIIEINMNKNNFNGNKVGHM